MFYVYFYHWLLICYSIFVDGIYLLPLVNKKLRMLKLTFFLIKIMLLALCLIIHASPS